MLNRAFEWERLIHPTPSDEMVTRRKAIVAAVLATFDSQKQVDDVLLLVSAALTGLSPKVAADVEYAQTLTEATKKHHAAFPSLLSENALDLQLTACLVVGELLTRKAAKQTWTEPQDAAAGLCLSAAGLMPSAPGQHLKSVQEALLTASRERLARVATSVRERPEYDPSELEELSPSGDAATFWSVLKPALLSTFEAVTQASAIDREELEVLWWLYNNKSLTFAQPLSEMAAYDLAFAAPIELVDRALSPAPASLNRIILGHVARGSNKPSAAGKALKSVLGAWTTEVIGSLLPESADERTLVAAWPKVLPLTWIAGKIVDAGVTTGWEQEFASRTGLNANVKITPDALANQVFVERSAQRLLSPLAGEQT